MTSIKKCGRFFQLDNLDSVIKILASRLPLSASIYNTAKVYNLWRDESRWFVLDNENPQEDSWILVINSKGDFGQEVCISEPPGGEITREIKNAFTIFEEIDWTGNVVFSAISIDVTTMISEISLRDKGKVIQIHPCYLFFMSIEEASLIDDNFPLVEGSVLKSLDNKAGNKFIRITWKYAQASDDFLEKLLSRNVCAGVYIDGKPVSGAGVTSHGLIGMLHTLEEHRGKGNAKFCMKTIMKKLGKAGLIPSCAVELPNNTSMSFQFSIGFTRGPIVDYVIVEKTTY